MKPGAIGVVVHPRRESHDLIECVVRWADGHGKEVRGLEEARDLMPSSVRTVSEEELAVGAGLVMGLGGDGTVLNYAVKILILGGKVGLFITFFMLIRWTIPRFRYDQLMGLAWQTMIPLSLVNLVAVMVVREYGLTPWVLVPLQLLLLIGTAALRLRKPTLPPFARTGKHPALIDV